jgi:hypothetical protein
MHKLSFPCLKIVNRMLLQRNRCLKVSSPAYKHSTFHRSERIERAKTLKVLMLNLTRRRLSAWAVPTREFLLISPLPA